jgi:hypothetical protein
MNSIQPIYGFATLTSSLGEHGYEYFLRGEPAICMDNAGVQGLPEGESVLSADRKVYGLSGNNQSYLKLTLPAGTLVHVERCNSSYGFTTQIWVRRSDYFRSPRP